LSQEIKAMLFADIVGFTKLTEMQIPPFVEHFMGKVAELMAQMKHPPIHKNTWGDAVCCVFDHVAEAGIFALDLRDMVRGTNWNQWSLPNELNIRIALHAGPVFACYDPVLNKLTYNGSHVNRTARIEPVAEEGQIYASQAFAALATAEGVAEFVCDYVGTKQLAKKYGAIPVFLVRRTA
jgi:class 3 adenylate cyclase